MADPSAQPEEGMKKFAGPVTVEHHFKVDGRKLSVLVTFPAALVEEVGMENAVLAANRALVTAESKNHKIEKFRQ